MIVALDGQVLMNDKKSGISILAQETIKELIQDDRLHCKLQIFSQGRTPEQLSQAKDIGVSDIEECSWLRRGIYLRLWHYLPFPYRWIFGKGADVSVFFNYDTPPGVKGAVLTYVHDMTFMAYPETMDDDVRRILRRNMEDTCSRADRILTLSQFSKQEIMKYMGVPERKIRVIPCGVDFTKFHTDYDPQQIEQVKNKYGISEGYFLYLGTLEPRKNLPFLIRAYAQAKQEYGNPFPKLVLGGAKGWHYDDIFAEVHQQDVQDDVVFTDYLPREDIAPLMSGAIAFLFPSLYEGFGIPPLEAMACGTPVIVSDRASLPEVVGDAGMVVSVETTKAMSEAIRSMLSPSTRNVFVEKGLQHVTQFTWERSAKLLGDVCLEFAGQ